MTDSHGFRWTIDGFPRIPLDYRRIPTDSAGDSTDSHGFRWTIDGFAQSLLTSAGVAMGYTGAVSHIVYATVSATDCNRSKTDSAGLGNSASAADPTGIRFRAEQTNVNQHTSSGMSDTSSHEYLLQICQ